MAIRVLLSFFAGVLLTVFVVAGTIYAVDPFHYFRWREPPHLASLMQRHSTAGQIRNTRFDTVILGNSTAVRLDQASFAGFPGNPVIGNLAMWGATLEENAMTLELALQEQSIKRVIWLVGNQQLDGYRGQDFPNCMYRPFLGVPYCYLFNMGIFQEAVDLALPFLDYEDRAAWRHDVQTWKSYMHFPMQVGRYVCELRNFAKLPLWARRWQNTDFQSIDRTGTNIFQEYERLVFPLVDAHPEVEFIFVFPPMFHVELVRYIYQDPNFAMFYMALVEHGLLPRKNVRVFDFRFSPLNRDPDEYLDAAHFSENVTREMVRMIAAGEFRVTDTRQEVRSMIQATEAAVKAFQELYEEYAPCEGEKRPPQQKSS